LGEHVYRRPVATGRLMAAGSPARS